jgi:metal-responsive CopG/Arc/MetJ family transcriptional regulator
MSRAVKFAISIPNEDFKELEAYRKKNRMSRSRLVREAISLWKKSREMEKLIKNYEDGYRRVPENPQEIRAWEKASLASFSQEEW